MAFYFTQLYGLYREARNDLKDKRILKGSLDLAKVDFKYKLKSAQINEIRALI
ncbi:hypothetical protein UM650_03075 [Staphylococcus aureus]|nr:hypothetical protein UM650_03075 [Staphylococcus aureus]